METVGRFELNNVYCGDSYKLIKEIPDKSIDCIYSDIPYLYQQGSAGSSELGQRIAKRKLELMGFEANYMNAKGTSRSEALRIAKNTAKKRLDFISIEDGIDYAILDDFVRIMKKINCFIWCSKMQIFDILKYFIGGGIQGREIYFEILTWNKSNPTPTTNNGWLPDIEYCLYFREKGVKYNSGYELKSKWYISPTNVIDKNRFTHPTCKPTNLIEKHLLHTTQENDIIFDPFAGSCSTLVSAKNTKRRFLGFELSEKWCKIGKDRLNDVDATGQYSMFTK